MYSDEEMDELANALKRWKKLLEVSTCDLSTLDEHLRRLSAACGGIPDYEAAWRTRVTRARALQYYNPN